MTTRGAAGAIGINELFPHQVCINLDRRPERWAESQQEFARHGIKRVKRVSAVDGDTLVAPPHWRESNGAYGCLLSHLRVVEEARLRRRSNILIFEDDVEFDVLFREKFARYARQLPPDWDMLFLGAFLRSDPLPVSQHVHRVRDANSTFAYALNHTVFDEFIASNSRALTAVDDNNHELQREFNCYCFMPHLAWVKPLYSDAQERFANHWYLRESLALAGKKVNQYLARALLMIVFYNPSQNRCLADNLVRLARKYRRAMENIAIAVVEQGAAATISTADLPGNCRYRFINNGGALDRAMCFNTAVRESDPSKDVFVFLDGDVFLEGKDIRGNIAMCHKYDGATGFDRLSELSDADSDRFVNDEASSFCGLDLDHYAPVRESADFSRCCFFNRTAFQEAGGWAENGSARLTLVRSESIGAQPLRLFKSPNGALRLKQRDE